MNRLPLAVLFLAAVPLALIGGGPGDDQAAVTPSLPTGAKFFLNDSERAPNVGCFSPAAGPASCTCTN